MSRARIRNAKKSSADRFLTDLTHPPRHMRRVPLDFAYRGGVLLAGPYRTAQWRSGALLIKLAAELRYPCDVSVRTADFSAPDETEFRHALRLAARRLIAGGTVVVGCGFGIGRTGTFLAALYKLHREILYYAGISRTLGDDAARDPVTEVRENYYAGAVETREQALFVRELDLRWMARLLALRLRPLAVFDKRFWRP